MLIALYKTFRGGEWVGMSLDSINKHVDAIVAVHSTCGWVGTSLRNNCIGRFNEWVYVNHRKDDYHSITGDFKTQEEQYAAGWEYIQSNYPGAQVLIIDTDEIWDEEELRELKGRISLRDHTAYSCSMRTYIKSPYYRIAPAETCHPVVVIDTWEKEILGVRGNKLPDIQYLQDIYMHHFTYVRKYDKDIELKFMTSEAGDHSASRSDWLSRVWPQVPEVRDFHPTVGHEKSWATIEIITTADLPAAVQGKEVLNANDCIWEKHKDVFIPNGFTREIMNQITEIAFLYVWDAYHLFMHAANMPDNGTFLEIGGNRGGSLLCVYLGLASRNKKAKLLTIEPFFGDEVKEWEFMENTRGIQFQLYKDIADNVHPIIPDNSIDLFFIDGSHSYDCVKSDITNYWPKLAKGGVMLGHDYDFGFIMRGYHDPEVSDLPLAVVECLHNKEITKLYHSSIFKAVKESDNESL
jgi:hypothetical protein